MTNLDKIGKDNAKLMLEAFSFLGKDKIGFIKNTEMFKFLNNDYESIHTRDNKKVVYKSKVRYDKDKDYLDHSKIIIPLELNNLLICNVIDVDQYQRLTEMSKSKDLEMVKLAEDIVFQKRQEKLKSKIYKCLKTIKKEM